jgi:ribosomal-protein-alanine N-acetyltransferase
MLAIDLNPFPILSTERLTLREVSKGDAEEIFFLRSDKEVLTYLDRDPAKSIDDAIQWIEMINEATKKNEVATWAIGLKDQPKLIGTITFWNIRKEHHRAEIGYVLHPSYQGKGLMQEAMATALNYGFNKIKLHSVEANVNPENKASINLLERNNFIREAYLRESWFYNGKFFDTAIYSLINPVS